MYALRLIVSQGLKNELVELENYWSKVWRILRTIPNYKYKISFTSSKIVWQRVYIDVLYPYLGYVARYATASIERGRFSPETNYHSQHLHSLKNKDINTALNYLRLDLQLRKMRSDPASKSYMVEGFTYSFIAKHLACYVLLVLHPNKMVVYKQINRPCPIRLSVAYLNEC